MNELISLIALTRILPYQSQIQRTLLDAMGSASAIYEARNNLRDAMPEASDRLVQAVRQMEQHIGRAEEEMTFAQKSSIRLIGINDNDYPTRLRECPDAPLILYYRGTVDLNSRHIVSMVGTRKITEYGRTFCHRFLQDLANICPDVIVISGLAYGVDICSHREALANNFPTVGVLAHGLDQIYPRMHRDTAIRMLNQGGLLTEYMSQTVPDKVNFVARNRIVAGISDATVVVESANKGGSLITADIAAGYNRDVFAVPGRIGDERSVGCNSLIRDSRAALLQSAEEFVSTMGWATRDVENRPIQRELFTNITPEQMPIYNALRGSEGKQLNLLTVETNIPIGRLSSLLFEMEMQGVVHRLSGGMYRLT